jgi:hypothetical protein
MSTTRSDGLKITKVFPRRPPNSGWVCFVRWHNDGGPYAWYGLSPLGAMKRAVRGARALMIKEVSTELRK